MSTTAVSNASNSAATAATATSGKSGANKSMSMSAQDQTDRFMKLLVAQLNNQDPLNPMDNAQMTTQIAQINTVAGIQQVNDSIQSMAGQFSAMQMMQGSSLIGHDVLSSGNRLAVKDGRAQGAVDLSSKADKVTVKISTPGGQLLDTLELGPQSAGRVNFQWDASKYSGSATPVFTVTASAAGKGVNASTLSRDTVASVSNDAGTLNLSLTNGQTLAYSAVTGIF